jgi:hypothetical protein
MIHKRKEKWGLILNGISSKRKKSFQKIFFFGYNLILKECWGQKKKIKN